MKGASETMDIIRIQKRPHLLEGKATDEVKQTKMPQGGETGKKKNSRKIFPLILIRNFAEELENLFFVWD